MLDSTRIDLRRFKGIWTCAALLVLLLGVSAELIRYVLAPGRFVETLRIVSLDLEGTLPVWFSSATFLLIAGVALLLGMLTPTPDRVGRRAWFLIGAASAWISLDETAAIHEHAGKMILILVPSLQGAPRGPFYFTWTIIGLAVLVTGAILLGPWFLSQPRSFIRRAGLGFAMMCAGAIGLEMLGGWALEVDTPLKYYAIITTVEETFEIVGAGILLFALLDRLPNRSGRVELQIRED